MAAIRSSRREEAQVCFRFPDFACHFLDGSFLRRLLRDGEAQIFFQPGEGTFKGVVVLPVRKIGHVIFADLSCRAEATRKRIRQIFAGVRV
jgi:hypothetical protein